MTVNNKKIREHLVSIIVPVYNSEMFIADTIQSIINQTYENWEAILVDDCSTDKTSEIIHQFKDQDPRVHYYQLSQNMGAAMARNYGVEKASGKYMAFLDSDDLWYEQKLTEQIQFMEERGYIFTCTDYRQIDEEGNCLEKLITAHSELDYEGLLKSGTGNSTVIYDASYVGKVQIPDIKKRNDYVMWLKVIKKAGHLYGLNKTLGAYRIRKGSLSSNKLKLIKYHWVVYRHIEGLSLSKSMYLLLYWIMKSAFKLK